MKIALASDHAGLILKEALVPHLRALGHEADDLGTNSYDSTDYPDWAEKAARAVASGAAERAIICCGSGIGVSIAANKVHGVRAALVHDEIGAELSRRHNDANALCMGARTTTVEEAQKIVETWIAAPFDGGRHEARVKKLGEIETRNPAG